MIGVTRVIEFNYSDYIHNMDKPPTLNRTQPHLDLHKKCEPFTFSLTQILFVDKAFEFLCTFQTFHFHWI